MNLRNPRMALLLLSGLSDARSRLGSRGVTVRTLSFFRSTSSFSSANDILSSKQRWNLFYISLESLEQGEQLLLQVGL